MKEIIFEITKFFLLMLFGLMIAFIASFAFDGLDFATSLLPEVFDSVWRFGLILLCSIAVVIVLESFDS